MLAISKNVSKLENLRESELSSTHRVEHAAERRQLRLDPLFFLHEIGHRQLGIVAGCGPGRRSGGHCRSVNVFVHGDAHSPKVGKITASIKLRRQGRWVFKRCLCKRDLALPNGYTSTNYTGKYSTLDILVSTPWSGVLFYTCNWLPLLAFHRNPGIIPEPFSKEPTSLRTWAWRQDFNPTC